MKTILTVTTALCTLLTASTLAHAQNADGAKTPAPAAGDTSNMDKLQDFKSTGAMKNPAEGGVQ